MEHGRITWGRGLSNRGVAWAIRFFLAAALTGCQSMGGYAPFALGCVAAAGPGAAGLAALLGTAAGAVAFLPFADALPHLASGVLILTAATAFQGSRPLSGRAAGAATAVGMFLAVSGIYVLQSLSPLEKAAPCLAAAGLTGAAAWFLWPLLRPGEGKAPPESLVCLAGALLLALGEAGAGGAALGRTLLCALLVSAAYEYGAMAGAAAGLCLGLMADLCGGGSLATAAWGLGGLLAGRYGCRRRGTAALAFLAGTLAVLLPSQALEGQSLALEAAGGMAVFLLLPARLFGGKRVQRPPVPESAAGVRLRHRLDRAASALRDLYDSMGRTPSTEENPAVIFDRAAERVCRECALCALCWQREYTGTFNALNDATPYLLERGRVLAKDLPAYFADRCIHLSEFLTAVNGELSAFLLRRQYRRQLEETRRSARGQYAQLSELLTATAATLEETAPAFAPGAPVCQVGAVLRPKRGETVCGDTVVSFRTEGGLWCLLLADGMGSGESARKESALTCRLLRQFLEAGVQPEAALKTLNGAMALRGAETGSFTTMDLCTLDTAAGEAVFYKYGAAPSYLKRGGIVRRVTGGSLPVGLRGAPAPPDVTHIQPEPGSFTVMISDGVAEAERDEWLMDLLAGWEGEDPQALAGAILAESIRRQDLQDDCGIQVLYWPAAAREV